MKAIILAGGKGTRLAEETIIKPKPMVEIGGMPIIWHIMKIYESNGITDFIVCLGHKGQYIKDWFANYHRQNSDLYVDMSSGAVSVLKERSEPWRVTLVETGEESYTGKRLQIARKYLNEGEAFCMTYGDGVGNFDIKGTLAAHELNVKNGKLVTVSVAQPEGRFGAVEFNGETVSSFVEKPLGDGSWINAGFFIIEQKALDYVGGVDCMWEESPMRQLAADGKVSAWKHHGFWRPMDTFRDKMKLESMWESGAPWKVW